MRIVSGWVTLLVAVIVIMVPGTVGADALPPGFSDSFIVSAGSQQVGGPFTLLRILLPEGPNETLSVGLSGNPFTIDLVEPTAGTTTIISDRLTINSFSFTITSDGDPGGLPPTPGAIPVFGESATLLEVLVTSDLDDPTASGGTSDTLTLLVSGLLPISIPFLEDSETSASPFVFVGRWSFDFIEPPTNIVSDSVSLDITLTFLSDDEAGLPTVPGATQLIEIPVPISMFSVAFESDVAEPPTVPAPPALSLLSVGLLPLGWRLWRTRRSEPR